MSLKLIDTRVTPTRRGLAPAGSTNPQLLTLNQPVHIYPEPLTPDPEPQGPAAPAGSTVINIDPPVIGDEDDSEDESDEDEVSHPAVQI